MSGFIDIFMEVIEKENMDSRQVGKENIFLSTVNIRATGHQEGAVLQN